MLTLGHLLFLYSEIEYCYAQLVMGTSNSMRQKQKAGIHFVHHNLHVIDMVDAKSMYWQYAKKVY